MRLQTILKELLLKNDITVAKLSKATDIPRQTLDNWLAGQEPRSLRQVKTVADYFNKDLDYLCFGEEAPLPNNIHDYQDEINAGVFEVVLRRVRK